MRHSFLAAWWLLALSFLWGLHSATCLGNGLSAEQPSLAHNAQQFNATSRIWDSNGRNRALSENKKGEAPQLLASVQAVNQTKGRSKSRSRRKRRASMLLGVGIGAVALSLFLATSLLIIEPGDPGSSTTRPQNVSFLI